MCTLSEVLMAIIFQRFIYTFVNVGNVHMKCVHTCVNMYNSRSILVVWLWEHCCVWVCVMILRHIHHTLQFIGFIENKVQTTRNGEAKKLIEMEGYTSWQRIGINEINFKRLFGWYWRSFAFAYSIFGIYENDPKFLRKMIFTYENHCHIVVV